MSWLEGSHQSYVEDHEPNKRARMVAKPKATPGPYTPQGFGPPDNPEHALAMLSGFNSNQMSMLVHAGAVMDGPQVCGDPPVEDLVDMEEIAKEMKQERNWCFDGKEK